jgi:hypothetical protein
MEYRTGINKLVDPSKRYPDLFHRQGAQVQNAFWISWVLRSNSDALPFVSE